MERLKGVAMPWSDMVFNAGSFAAALGIRRLDDIPADPDREGSRAP